MRKQSRIALSIAFLSFLFCYTSSAQKFKQSFLNISLSDALVQTSKELGVKVAFDSRKLSSIIINKEVTGNSSDEFFADLLANTGFQFVYKHRRYLIVDNPVSKIVLDTKECMMIGAILDKETGEQLPYASVSLVNQNYNTYASENGTFSLKNISYNPMHLMVSFIGYQPIDTLINWESSSINCDFRLNRKVQKIDTVMVSANRPEMIDFRNNVDFATVVNPSKLIDLPMLAETDVFKTLQLLPGIRYSENSAELSIRGGSGDQNLVLYDGQTLYNLSHYFGVFSSLNPNIIKDIQIYKGGYDSRYGERVSGIVDITGKSGNQMKATVYGDINLISANLAAEVPLNKKLTLIVAGRRSYSDIYSTGLANSLFEKTGSSFTGTPTSMVETTKPSFYFYDYDTKLTYRINNKENISISYYGGKDFFDNTYSNSDHNLKVNNSDKNTWKNYGLSAIWLRQWSSTFYSDLQMGTSGYTNVYNNSTLINQPMVNDTARHRYLPETNNLFNTYNKNTLTDYSVSLRNTAYLSNNNQLSFGLSARRNDIYYYKDAGSLYVYDNTYQSAWLTSIYGQDRVLVGQRFMIKPGFRASYYNGNNQFYIEPRIAVNYKFSEKFSARAASGRYYQFISQVLSPQETGYNKSFWALADDSLHPVISSNHYIFGSTFESSNFLFDVEAYYKTYSGLQEYIYISQYLKNSDFPNYFPPHYPQTRGGDNNLKSVLAANQSQPSYYIVGDGKSYGIDFLVRYKIKNFTSWVSYSIGRSLQQFPKINNGNEIPAPTDQTHQLSWTNMVSLNKWNFGATTLFASGRPYIDFSQSEQNLPTIRDYKRLPDYFRTDLSVNYNFKLGGTKLKIGATIINLFNSQNYFDINTRKFDFENTSFSETNLIRSQSLSLNLFVHFVL